MKSGRFWELKVRNDLLLLLWEYMRDPSMLPHASYFTAWVYEWLACFKIAMWKTMRKNAHRHTHFFPTVSLYAGYALRPYPFICSLSMPSGHHSQTLITGGVRLEQAAWEEMHRAQTHWLMPPYTFTWSEYVYFFIVFMQFDGDGLSACGTCNIGKSFDERWFQWRKINRRTSISFSPNPFNWTKLTISSWRKRRNLAVSVAKGAWHARWRSR